jgi:hypothetical protein
VGDGSTLAEGNDDDDTIIAILNQEDKQTLLGGAGDDSIKFLTDTTAGFFTIKGGAGDDTLNHSGAGVVASGYTYLYDSFAEFYSSNDVVDKITTNGSNVNVTHTFVISGALKFDDADEISNLTNSGTSTTALTTAKSVTGSSTVTLDSTEAALFDTIDISAGTTGSSKIDLSASSADHTIKGSKTARNTLSGGTGDDTITGGSGNDLVTAGTGSDVVDFGSGGVDKLVQVDGDSIAASDSEDGEENVWADGDKWGTTAESITHANGLDEIFGFTSNDVITGLGAALDSANLGDETTLGALADGELVVGYGSYVSATGVFTTAAAFNADSAADAYVTLLGAADAAGFTGATNVNTIVLQDLTVALADSNFTA